jgi:outer membrane protein TolC
MQLELSLDRIHTANLNIKSSKSALKAAKSALKTITQKYNAGVVDNVVYLDALSAKTQAQATYEKALNDLEIAYAIYYYYNNKNIEEFLQ